ncbi:MAG: TIGR04282 family arsenosugar biosynthesis glycosyltransferase [Pseudomonadota bacterium]
MRRHVVIFARTPQAGRVKRRLAASIGATAAMRFYRALLEAQLRRLSGDRRWTVWICATPDSSLGHPVWHHIPRPRRIGQADGDLGRRMGHALRSLPPGPAVLVGSDIPALRGPHIVRAFALLGEHDLVFGPATDGGFWLVGARRLRPLPYRLFAGARWSTPHALADVLAGIPADQSVALADALDDVDDVHDLDRVAGPFRLRA